MMWRVARPEDVPFLVEWNKQLIQDEGHRNPMTVAELEERMRDWLVSGEYRAVVFEENECAVAYALFKESETEVHLRQFFVTRSRRREGIGRQAILRLLSDCWPANKRLTVDVLTQNAPAISFWRALGYTDYALSLEIVPEAQRGTASFPTSIDRLTGDQETNKL